MTADTTLYERIWRVRVGDLDVTTLDIQFDIKRTLKREPNTCEVKIYNLSRENIAKLRSTNNIDIQVNAGFKSDVDPPLLFRGASRTEVYAKVDGTETVVSIKARDGGQMPRTRINRSYDAGVPLRRVLNDLVDAMGIGRGNLDDFINDPLQTSGRTDFPEGFVAAGAPYVLFDRTMRATGLRWSLQNGVIQILRRVPTRTIRGKLLNSQTGLIDYPTVDKNGKVTCNVLIQPGIEPGRIVRVESVFITGDFEVQEANYKGSTTGAKSDWKATLILKPIT
jgi:hypothetical protein